eukprot:gb/GECH01013875.1/.p1 GENE.gb/GECH01013875.1/~~gb/GECH01013875.1/.p1  ORF type:complete len:482 (+),score=107.54 gb/GECH01013875.1/:1-1446(+)
MSKNNIISSFLLLTVTLLCTLSLSYGIRRIRKTGGMKEVETILREHNTNDQTTDIEVFVMLQLDIITNQGHLKYPQKLQNQLYQLKSGGVDGVMTDVWWGLVETEPKQYNWKPYQQLVNMVKKAGLKIQVVMSFHRCGGNVGDKCDIPLPVWVQQVGDNNPDIYYTDQHGNRDKEYLSLGVDNQTLFGGRTAIDLYADYMQSFAETFEDDINNGTVVEVEVGLGPAGEMRYPSYQFNKGWQFPGIGEFQCYDKYLSQDLAEAAKNAGHPEWGHRGPNNAGNYNSKPYNTAFFGNGFNNWSTDYGHFFLNWYSQKLIDHGEAVLVKAAKVFGSRLRLSGKIAGIHWWYKTKSHAAELTAGYYNTADHEDGYLAIAKMFSKYNVVFDFTCLEMRDSEQPSSCDCGPQELVQQTEDSAWAAGIHYSGENALPRYDQTAYSQIESQAKRNGHHIDSFTYLRLNDQLLSGNNWELFKKFVSKMHNL